MVVHYLPKNGESCDECGGKIVRLIIGKLRKKSKEQRYLYSEPVCQNVDCRSVYWGFNDAPKEIYPEALKER